ALWSPPRATVMRIRPAASPSTAPFFPLVFSPKLNHHRTCTRMAPLHKSSSPHISLRCISFLLVGLLLFHTPSPTSMRQVAAVPVFSEEYSSSNSPLLVEEAFRARIAQDSTSKVYIDTLSLEEVAEHRKTGRLPKRTLELIER